jgi:NodT family efflux transporter outer membrane factor (OMF) lipoprotein
MLLLTACNFAPKYKQPAIEAAPKFKELTPEQSEKIGVWQRAAPSENVPRGNWWEMFGDTNLTAFESKIEVNNQNIVAAVARVEAARAIVQQSRASLFPLVALSPSVTRSRARLRTQSNSGALSTPNRPFTDYNLPLNASWELDFWGRIRNQVQANKFEAQATEADLENVRLSARAELATDYFQLRGLDAQKDLLESAVKAYQESFDLAKTRYQTGIASDQDVAQAETQLTTTRAQATDLGIQRAQLEHAIAVLLGESPSSFSIVPAPFHGRAAIVPFGIPSTLLQRRPDIAAAERRVMEDNVNIGVARAAYFPTITLSGSTGFQSSSLGDLATWPSFVWSIGGALSETIFDAGRRRGVTRQAWANYNESVANYRQTALISFKEVEDALASLRILNSEIQDENAAVEASRRYMTLASDRYKFGIDSYLNVITAQTTLLANQRTAVNLQFEQLTASVQLVKAIGGHWEQDLSDSQRKPEEK